MAAQPRVIKDDGGGGDGCPLMSMEVDPDAGGADRNVDEDEKTAELFNQKASIIETFENHYVRSSVADRRKVKGESRPPRQRAPAARRLETLTIVRAIK